MKNGVSELAKHIEDTYELQGSERNAVKAVLQSVVDLELPELEEELQQHQGKKFVTLGKVQFLEEIQNELQ